jgi:hypothetical protein
MQVDAYNYSEKVLVGHALETERQKSTPKFERAKYVGINGQGSVFVSGTASIQNEITLGIGDAELQTKVTIENIASLIDIENLKNAGVREIRGDLSYRFLRVYIKHEADVERIKALCEGFYGPVSIHYLIAEICRDDLLLEMEGEAVII